MRFIHQSPWAAAACLVLMLGGISYATYLLTSHKEKVIQNVKSIPKSLSENILAYTSYKFPSGELVEIITKDSMKIEIPPNTIASEFSEKDKISIISLTDLELLKTRAGYMVNIQFKKNRNKADTVVIYLSHDHFPKSAQLYYGGNETVPRPWQAVGKSKEEFISKPTPAMESYLQYVQGEALLDSIGEYYQLEREEYIHLGKKGFIYQKKFIDQIRTNSESYKHANNQGAIQSAEEKWSVYNRQHHLKISGGSGTIVAPKFTIHRAGWYAIYE